MPSQKLVTVYTYAELSPKAQEKAWTNYSYHSEFDPFWIVDNLARIKAKTSKWNADYGTATIAPIQESYSNHTILIALAELPEGEEYHEFSEQAKAILAKMDRLERINNLCYKARNSDNRRYDHFGELFFNLETDIEKETDDLLASLGKVVGKTIRQEYEYQTSEEYAVDYFEANEIEFLENGDIAPCNLSEIAA
jgi:hypothetical protein